MKYLFFCAALCTSSIITPTKKKHIVHKKTKEVKIPLTALPQDVINQIILCNDLPNRAIVLTRLRECSRGLRKFIDSISRDVVARWYASYLHAKNPTLCPLTYAIQSDYTFVKNLFNKQIKPNIQQQVLKGYCGGPSTCKRGLLEIAAQRNSKTLDKLFLKHPHYKQQTLDIDSLLHSKGKHLWLYLKKLSEKKRLAPKNEPFEQPNTEITTTISQETVSQNRLLKVILRGKWTLYTVDFLYLALGITELAFSDFCEHYPPTEECACPEEIDNMRHSLAIQKIILGSIAAVFFAGCLQTWNYSCLKRKNALETNSESGIGQVFNTVQEYYATLRKKRHSKILFRGLYILTFLTIVSELIATGVNYKTIGNYCDCLSKTDDDEDCLFEAPSNIFIHGCALVLISVFSYCFFCI